MKLASRKVCHCFHLALKILLLKEGWKFGDKLNKVHVTKNTYVHMHVPMKIPLSPVFVAKQKRETERGREENAILITI